MKRAVALFDFDNTIVQGDSIARLLHYDIKKHPLHSLQLIKTGFYYIGYLCHLCSFEKAKEIENDITNRILSREIPNKKESIIDVLNQYKEREKK